MVLTKTELRMIENVIGNSEVAYFVEDKVLNFRHYEQKRYWSVIFDLKICLQT